MNSIWLIAGLGNPGLSYKEHRHNVGFMVLDELKNRWNCHESKMKWGSEWVEARFQEKKVFLQKPMEFMNLSGNSITKASQFFQIYPEQIIVIHDELDLPFGQIRVKQGGGHGGHNGLRSISSCLGSNYIRIRFGIGRPSSGKEQVVHYVLTPFEREQQRELPFLFQKTAEMIESILTKGTQHTMNLYHSMLLKKNI